MYVLVDNYISIKLLYSHEVIPFPLSFPIVLHFSHLLKLPPFLLSTIPFLFHTHPSTSSRCLQLETMQTKSQIKLVLNYTHSVLFCYTVHCTALAQYNK